MARINIGGFYEGQEITIPYNGGTFTFKVVRSKTGRLWMDRNLGATQVATSSTDAAAYGDLFQWGRGDDGHQTRDSEVHDGAVDSYTPLAGNSWDGKFITVPNVTPWDWLSPQNNNLWQGHAGINNPCPMGWRLPTEAELNSERESWSSNNSAGAFDSPLKLTVGGYRDRSSASLSGVGSYGYYWSSTASGVNGRFLSFYSSDAYMYSNYRAYGISVRCLLDEAFEPRKKFIIIMSGLDGGKGDSYPDDPKEKEFDDDQIELEDPKDPSDDPKEGEENEPKQL